MCVYLSHLVKEETVHLHLVDLESIEIEVNHSSLKGGDHITTTEYYSNRIGQRPQPHPQALLLPIADNLETTPHPQALHLPIADNLETIPHPQALHLPIADNLETTPHPQALHLPDDGDKLTILLESLLDSVQAEPIAFSTTEDTCQYYHGDKKSYKYHNRDLSFTRKLEAREGS